MKANNILKIKYKEYTIGNNKNLTTQFFWIMENF